MCVSVCVCVRESERERDRESAQERGEEHVCTLWVCLGRYVWDTNIHREKKLKERGKRCK